MRGQAILYYEIDEQKLSELLDQVWQEWESALDVLIVTAARGTSCRLLPSWQPMDNKFFPPSKV